jgi:hypothetical protein
MSEPSQLVRPDVERVLSALKPFQRRSVDYVFDRLYGTDATPRFLLADEVGLGKTWVAKGVIAKAIDKLWDERERIDVVYICSNHDIARQNIDRLNITGNKDFQLASRITLLPLRDHETDSDGRQLKTQKLNFVSFTPGTSFDLKSNLGVSAERVLLFHLLAKPWGLSGVAPQNVLQGGCTSENFRNQIARFNDDWAVDIEMEKLFLSQVAKDRKLHAQFETLCDHYRRSDANVSDEVSGQRNDLIGTLREILARACLKAMKPDLIILDEFQRFKHLLVDDPDSEASQLARSLFRYSKEHNAARVLMLSATPYKMYTLGHESADDDHYVDFLNTVRFLYGDDAKTAEMEGLLKEYRRLLYRIGSDDSREILAVRAELEQRLRSVICRTERLAVTADRSGMLQEIQSKARLEPSDLDSYMAVQSIARSLDHNDTMEYWKSSPYLLSFMENYALKEDLEDGKDDSAVVAAFKAAQNRAGVLLPWDKLRSYGLIQSHNPRLRELIQDTVECGAWRTLWMPPSVPYYNMTGAFADPAMAKFTKRLVFSSWQVVPKMIATLVSYEAERRMINSHDANAQNTPEARKTVGRPLNFSRSKGRLTGMPVLGLMYPSYFLAKQFDPLRYMCDQPGGSRLDAADVLGLVEMGISNAIEPLIENAPDTGPEDVSWYWAAPILLDETYDPAASAAWWKVQSLAEKWLGADEPDDEQEPDSQKPEENAGWHKHVAEAMQVLAGGQKQLGRPPADLAGVLALLAIAGPAVTALRAIARSTGGLEMATDPHIRHNAGRIAFGFRSLFNAPEVIALLRGQNSAEPYWRRTLEYCAAGCLQAVMDEYIHVLSESPGDAHIDPEKLATKLGDAVVAVLNMQSSTPGANRISVDESGERLQFENRRLRAWFAMRFGDEKDETGKTVSRADQVRKAFNSPFWPFVLATTSVGQEGLDFHTYCHAVMHWNLPANPVDMEQREGRVHRYKGHAVRRNVAKRHVEQLENKPDGDPWSHLFDVALAETDDTSGLTPFWVYTAIDGATIQRHVPALPLSREADQLPALRKSLAVYRMVFGQPRQDDLIGFLQQQIPREDLRRRLDQLRMDLTPGLSSAGPYYDIHASVDSATEPVAPSPIEPRSTSTKSANLKPGY